MMIGVKGTKKQDRQGDPAARYELKNQDRKSNTPYVVGLLLTGIALYLKSMMPLFSRQENEGAASAKEPATPPEQQAILSAATEPQQAAASGDEAEPEDEPPVGSGGQLVDLMPPAQFMPVDSSAMEFVASRIPSEWQDIFVPPLVSLAANDNAVALPGTPNPAGKDNDQEKAEPNTPDTDDPDDRNPDDDGDEDHEDKGDEEPVEDDGQTDDDDEDYNAINRAPRVTGPVYLNDISGCAVLAIAMSELLRNAHDPDGDTLSVDNLTVSSGMMVESDEGWLFHSWPATEGLVTVTYQVTDGEFSVDQVAYFSIVKSIIEGSPDDDLILGTPCADEIDAGCGDDNVDSRGGDDLVSAGSGNDHIVAGAGDDVVYAGAGDDIVFGGSGNDYLAGESGSDRLYGGEGDDLLFGGAGDDFLDGGAGRDILRGDGGQDTLKGGEGEDILLADAGDDFADGGGGADLLDGAEGDDRLEGGGGADVLLDGTGADEVNGGDGDDRVVPTHDHMADRFDGGQGYDTLDYSTMEAAVLIDFETGATRIEDFPVDQFICFEAALGGSGNDELSGSEANEHLYGGAGADVLNGRAGDDLLVGGLGDDVIADGAGSDLVEAGKGNDRILAAVDGDDDHYDGGQGCDTLDYSQTSEGVVVDLQEGVACGEETGRDTITSMERVVGGDGDDHFITGQASVSLIGGQGEDVFEFPHAPFQSSGSSHLIFDFSVGDRIRMSKYDLFEKVMDEVEDHFEEIYGEQSDDDIPIRFSHDRNDQMARTVVEADLNDDAIWETTVYLQGHHVLMVVEHA